MTTVVVPYSTAMTGIGLGYDTATNRVKASPFSFEPEPKTVLFHSNNQGEDGPSQTSVQYQMRYIESRSDLTSALDISGKFSAKRANISGSLGGAFLDQNIDSKKNAYLLITVEVVHSVTTLAEPPEIEPERVPGHPNAATNTTDEQFFELYGDGYISAIHIGGRLDGLVEISAETSSDLLSIQAKGQAAVTGVLSGELSLEYAVGNLTENHQTRVNVNIVGGGMSFAPMDPRSLVRLCKTFPIMVNGGGGRLLEWNVKPVNETDIKQVPTEKQIEFQGIAVPLRAVVSLYKSLPVFRYSAPVLSRLSGYITDDLLEYYLSYDDAKNKVADLISNENEAFLIDDLKKLDRIRSGIREIQSQLLESINKVAELNDTEAANEAVRLIAELKPAEVYLRCALNVQKAAFDRVTDKKMKEDEEAQRLQRIRKTARQRLERFRRSSLDIGDQGISNNDVVKISLAKRMLFVGDPSSAFKWVREDDEMTLPMETLEVEAEQNVSRFHQLALRAAYNHRQQELTARLDSGSLSENDYFRQGSEMRAKYEDAGEFFQYIMELAGQGDTFSGMLTGIKAAVLGSVTAASGEEFTVKVEDGEKGLVRVHDSNGLYWRHTLQYEEYGIVTTEEMGAGEDHLRDTSFIFMVHATNFQSDNTTAEISPDAGRLNWRLFARRQIGPNGPYLICGAPQANLPSDIESRTFRLTLASSETS